MQPASRLSLARIAETYPTRCRKLGLMLSQTPDHAPLAWLNMTAMLAGVGRTLLPYLLTARFQLPQFGLTVSGERGAVLIETLENFPVADS